MCRFDANLRFLTLSLTLICVKSTQTRHKNTNLFGPPLDVQIYVGRHKYTNSSLSNSYVALTVVRESRRCGDKKEKRPPPPPSTLSSHSQPSPLAAVAAPVVTTAVFVVVVVVVDCYPVVVAAAAAAAEVEGIL